MRSHEPMRMSPQVHREYERMNTLQLSRSSGAYLEGALHKRRRQRVGMLSQAVPREWEACGGQPPGSYSTWTHAGVLGALTVLQMMPNTLL